jgi:O-antigen ligase
MASGVGSGTRTEARVRPSAGAAAVASSRPREPDAVALAGVGFPAPVDPVRHGPTAALAHLVVVVVGFDQRIVSGITPALVVAVALLPMWVPTLRCYPMARLLVGFGPLAVIAGWWLAQLSSVDHRVDRANQLLSSTLLLSGLAALALLLWARRHLPLHRVIALYGLGGVMSVLVGGDIDWKFGLGVPATYLLLGLAERWSARLLSALVVAALALVGALSDGRSLVLFCALAFTLTLWQARPAPGGGRRVNRWYPLALLAAVAVTGYFLLTALLTAGALGEEARERSEQQLEATGSVLTGGRPEWAATMSLVRLEPLGYGTGVVPDWKDLMAGRSGLASINVDTGGYATNYMFGGQFRLHSVAADLWVSYGWVGAALAVALAVALVRSLTRRLAERRAPTSVLFACALGLWYLLFGPIFSNWVDVCTAVAFALVVAPGVREPGEAPVGDGPGDPAPAGT